MGHHLYDKNKQLEAENTALRAELREARSKPAKDSDVVADAITAFFSDKAVLRVDRGNDGDTTLYVSFQMKS